VFHGLKTGFFYSLKLNFICYLNNFFTFDIQIPHATPDYTTTLQMLCANMEIMNKKLSKLDGIDKLNEKFDKPNL
jgi:hypothetical protein